MRRLDQHVACVGKRENVPRPQSRNEILHDMGVRAGDQTQRDTLNVENLLKFLNGQADSRPRVVEKPGQDMGRACNCPDPVGDPGPSHL